MAVFEGCAVTGVNVTLGEAGAPGKGYVYFKTAQDAQRGLLCNGAQLGLGVLELSPPWMGQDTGQVQFWLRIQGLPNTATTADIVAFFSGFRVSTDAVEMPQDIDGNPAGFAFVRFLTPQELRAALLSSGGMVGHNYVALCPATEAEVQFCRATNQAGVYITRVRNLPFRVTEADIKQFLAGIDVAEAGVTLIYSDGRPAGEAYVEFNSETGLEEALAKNSCLVGGRQVDVSRVTREVRDKMVLSGAAPESERPVTPPEPPTPEQAAFLQAAASWTFPYAY